MPVPVEFRVTAQRPTADHGWTSESSASLIDACALQLFDDSELQQSIRQLKKVELASVCLLIQETLRVRQPMAVDFADYLRVHQRLVAGLAGEALLVSSSLVFDTLSEAEGFFDMSFKTIKSRMGGVLDTAASERAMRAVRATLTAAESVGGLEAARAYLHTPNYALGGHTPVELLKTSEGERLVLNELHTQAECGPL